MLYAKLTVDLDRVERAIRVIGEGWEKDLITDEEAQDLLGDSIRRSCKITESYEEEKEG